MVEEKKEEGIKDNETGEETKEESVEEIKDRLLRLAAEFDNYKKRSAKDVENAKSVGKAEFTTKLLPILDEFELALESFEMKNETEKGIALVYSNLNDALKKEGLREIETEGAFDPYKHEIMMIKGSDKKEGVILDVVRKGYTLNGILIRPASVIVSKGNGVKEKKDDQK